MKVGDVVIAPEGCFRYLTAGKKYKVVSVDDLVCERVVFFDIINDDGAKIFCISKECSHLNGQDWIIPQRKWHY